MNNSDEIVYHLKRGRGDLARNILEEKVKEKYPQDFRTFMDQMIEEHHVSRKNIAIRSGLSQDYTYKLLRGDKKAGERDYIIAICFALQLTISQTQHALKLAGMQTLNREDPRSNIIFMARAEMCDIDKLNDWLQDANYDLLKVSPDMPSARIEIGGSESNISTAQKRTRILKEISRDIQAEHYGNAPMDYRYCGVIKVEDENNDILYVEADYNPEGEFFLVFDEENYEKQFNYDEIEDVGYELQVLEQYDTLLDATSSDFFSFFLELDHATDKKVIETMDAVDDTRNYEIRIGACLNGGTRKIYLEAFDTQNPAEKRYVQILEEDGTVRYSASHESYFMRYELGELYPIYFGEKKPEEYYVSVNTIGELPNKNQNLKFIFKDLSYRLHKYVKETFGGLFSIDENELVDEAISVIAQESTTLFHMGDYDSALNKLSELLSLLDTKKREDFDTIHIRACTYYKIAIAYGKMRNEEAQHETWQKIYGLRKLFSQDSINYSDENAESLLSIIAECALYLAQAEQNKGNTDTPEAEEYVDVCIGLLEGHCLNVSTWITLYQAYQKKAYMIDAYDPEHAVELTELAIDIARDQQIDHMPEQQRALATLYNNHAWVLWNKLNREEAVIYYGRAIDICEAGIKNGNNKSDWTDFLNHVATALYGLYITACKNHEAERLKKKMEKYGLDLKI